MILLRTILESFRLAFQQLRSNKLRSFLSLLGITIGIFCIIAVKSAVDSLSSSIIDIFGGISKEVMMVDIFPYDEDPEMNFWKYFRRPMPTEHDFNELKERLESHAAIAMIVGLEGKTIKNKSNSIQGPIIMGSTAEFGKIQDMELAQGRFFLPNEFNNGPTKTIIGDKVATELFPNEDALGKSIKLLGQKFDIIGVLEKEGENLFNVQQMDLMVWMPFNTAKRFVDVKGKSRFEAGRVIYVLPKEGVTVEEMGDEITGELRAIRRLKPTEDDNFAVNSMSQFMDIIEGFFGQVNIAGYIIGGFAILVGLISVANIMFVSVKERTNIIGIKKALGAKRFIILMEFLVESVFLCILGGLLGLLMVYGIAIAISAVLPFKVTLSATNIIIGLSSSIIIGILAGMLPALQASKLDPVEAIRSK